MAEEDARSEESFQSADDDDDFDLPQDVGGGGGAASSGGAPGLGGGAMPPGLDDGGDAVTERWNLRKDGNREELDPIIQRLSVEREHIKISKMFSYVLRHAAHKLDVSIRKDGFVRLREIMKLRNFKPYNLEELMAVVYFDEKERYTMVREFDGELLIRANQGHTMKVIESEQLLDLVEDPQTVAECVHGTYLVHWPFIKRQGLSKVARNHIHLANGLPEDGKIRGMRSTAELFIYVDIPKAMGDGVVFYRSKNDVILTVGVDGWLPVKYFLKAVRIDYNTCEIEEMEFDAGLDVPRWAAELAPTGPGEEGTYVVKNLEALIGNCRKRLADINDLKAHQENGNELTEEEAEKISKHAQVYTELQSLEQRWRQHKGHRRESQAEKQQRVREEAEAGTIVARKDRAETPPWERNRKNDTEALSAANRKVSEKEKAEWAAIGKRRENAEKEPPKPKKEDPWEQMGRARQTAPTPTAAGSRNLDEEDDFLAKRFSRKESFKQKDEEREDRLRKQESMKSEGGRPRFFNSKKQSDGPGWRDRLAGGSKENLQPEKEEPSWRDRQESPPPDDEPSWRAQPSPDNKPSRPAQPPPDNEPSWRAQPPDNEPSWRAQQELPAAPPQPQQVAAPAPSENMPQVGQMVTSMPSSMPAAMPAASAGGALGQLGMGYSAQATHGQQPGTPQARQGPQGGFAPSQYVATQQQAAFGAHQQAAFGTQPQPTYGVAQQGGFGQQQAAYGHWQGQAGSYGAQPGGYAHHQMHQQNPYGAYLYQAGGQGQMYNMAPPNQNMQYGQQNQYPQYGQDQGRGAAPFGNNAGYNQGNYADQRSSTQKGNSGASDQSYGQGYYGGGQRQGAASDYHDKTDMDYGGHGGDYHDDLDDGPEPYQDYSYNRKGSKGRKGSRGGKDDRDKGDKGAKGRFAEGSMDGKGRFEEGFIDGKGRFGEGSMDGKGRFGEGSMDGKGRFGEGSMDGKGRFGQGSMDGKDNFRADKGGKKGGKGGGRGKGGGKSAGGGGGDDEWAALGRLRSGG